MYWYQHALLEAILKIFNSLRVSEMVGPGMGARNYCKKQLLMSVGDRENYNPCFGKLCSVLEENVCQVKIPVKPGRIQKNDWLQIFRDCKLILSSREIPLIDVFWSRSGGQ